MMVYCPTAGRSVVDVTRASIGMWVCLIDASSGKAAGNKA
jgi:hypothetical protein